MNTRHVTTYYHYGGDNIFFKLDENIMETFLMTVNITIFFFWNKPTLLRD